MASKLEKFAAWRWWWLSIPRLCVVAAIAGGFVASAVGYKLQDYGYSTDAALDLLLFDVIFFGALLVYLVGVRMRYEGRLASDADEFEAIFQTSASSPGTQERVDSVLTQLAAELENADGEAYPAANGWFVAAHRSAADQGFRVKDSYLEYLHQ